MMVYENVLLSATIYSFSENESNIFLSSPEETENLKSDTFFKQPLKEQKAVGLVEQSSVCKISDSLLDIGNLDSTE